MISRGLVRSVTNNRLTMKGSRIIYEPCRMAYIDHDCFQTSSRIGHDITCGGFEYNVRMILEQALALVIHLPHFAGDIEAH